MRKNSWQAPRSPNPLWGPGACQAGLPVYTALPLLLQTNSLEQRKCFLLIDSCFLLVKDNIQRKTSRQRKHTTQKENPKTKISQQVEVLNWTGKNIKGDASRNMDVTLDTVHGLNTRLRWNVKLECGVAKWWEGCGSVMHWVKDVVRVHFSKKLPCKAHLPSPLHAAKGGWFMKESSAPHTVFAVGFSTVSAFVTNKNPVLWILYGKNTEYCDIKYLFCFLFFQLNGIDEHRT